MKIQFDHTFTDIVSGENILEAWKEFIGGKRSKKDIHDFSLHLMDNIFSLHNDLSNHTYAHGGYQAFTICDPKPRDIHKAAIRDRVAHHALCRALFPFFERIFIADSFSCRIGKGTHKALNRFRAFAYRVSKNNTRTCWVLKGDIKKFFASIDHHILMEILGRHIPNQDVLWLIREIVSSFSSTKPGIGLPLGNLTSQLLVNIYMNEFDQFVKHTLKARYYIRYADDFVLLSGNRGLLESCLPSIEDFLRAKLRLTLHPDKLFVKTLASGVDFLGWVHFSDHQVLRTSTKRRMMKKLKDSTSTEMVSSYLGLLRHGNTYRLQEEIFQTTPRRVYYEYEAYPI